MLMGLEVAAASQIEAAMAHANELTEPYVAYEVVRTLPPGAFFAQQRAMQLAVMKLRSSGPCLQVHYLHSKRRCNWLS